MISSCQEAEKEFCLPRVWRVFGGLWYGFVACAEDRATRERDPSAARAVIRLGEVCRVCCVALPCFLFVFPPSW